ncbi:hypothetical protein, partial [Salmonella sp. s54412]|uniref:hypothetical protein n=1 Tax=Salmonella sp. s54412 TaxID=3160128 RepID=UPI0037551A92
MGNLVELGQADFETLFGRPLVVDTMVDADQLGTLPWDKILQGTFVQQVGFPEVLFFQQHVACVVQPAELVSLPYVGQEQ